MIRCPLIFAAAGHYACVQVGGWGRTEGVRTCTCEAGIADRRQLSQLHTQLYVRWEYLSRSYQRQQDVA